MFTKKCSSIILLSALTACLGACSQENVTKPTSESAGTTQRVLLDFESPTLPDWVNARNSAIAITTQGVSQGSQSLSLTFSSEHEYSAVDFTPDELWNWSELGPMNLAFDITNNGAQSVHLYLRVTDQNGAPHMRSISIPAQSTGTYYADLSGQQLEVDSGMRAAPPAWHSNEQRMFWMNGKNS